MSDSDGAAHEPDTADSSAQGVTAIQSLTERFLGIPFASRRQYAGFGIGVFAIVNVIIGTVLTLRGIGPYGLGVACVINVCLTALILIPLTTSNSSPPLWSCVVPELPLRGPDLANLSELLEEIRMRAYQHLHEEKDDLKNEQVRANAFLADYNLAGEGYAFQLVMPDALRKEMHHPPECTIQLKPEQGLTGRVFTDGRRGIVHRIPDDKGQWDDTYKLTDELKAKVHPKLKWIVSLPIQDPETQVTLAVLNIDGLDADFGDKQLSILATKVFGMVKAFEICLAKQPQVAVSLTVAEIQP